MRFDKLTVARALIAVSCLAGAAPSARAGVEAWRVNEVAAEPGDPALRYVELYAPPSATPDNCFFPTTRLEILDAAGVVVGTVTPFSATTCYGGDTYFLFAPVEVEAAFGVDADAPLPYALAPAGGQVCLRSSALRYDCARWGSVSPGAAATDQQNPADVSVAPALQAGLALERIQDTSVVVADFLLDEPTPRAPNDGSAWFPPDAGPIPDAAPPPPDAASLPDAEVVIDAGARLDAREQPPAFLDAQPGGGCGIAGAARPTRSLAGTGIAMLGGLIWLRRRRR